MVLTGAVHEPHVQQLAALAHDSEISTLALLEPTDSERAERVERLRATEVMTKPVAPDDVVATARRLMDRRHLQERTGIVGESAPIQEVLVKIEQMAPVSSTVLVQGESGSGKELVAKGLHDLSPRRNEAFITVNCAALPETLLESELFGHEKGAFTGAAERRLGRFELADGGTIFLDEIGEIPLSTQVKLLRVLESRTFFRVGGTQPIKVDVRVVAATNRALRDAVTLGEFRDDLYYRLNVLNIYLPPLRERRADIPLLVRRFIREFAKTHDRPFRGITPEAMQRLVNAPWPGNVRQLRNLVESMVVLAPGRRDPGVGYPAGCAGGSRDAAADADGGSGAGGQRDSASRVRVHPPEPGGPPASDRGAAPPARRSPPAGAGDRAGRPLVGGRRDVGQRPGRRSRRALPARNDDGRGGAGHDRRRPEGVQGESAPRRGDARHRGAHFVPEDQGVSFGIVGSQESGVGSSGSGIPVGWCGCMSRWLHDLRASILPDFWLQTPDSLQTNALG